MRLLALSRVLAGSYFGARLRPCEPILPVRALRRAERALDAAAAAAKVSMVLALKMVVLPTVLGAGLEIAIKPDLAQVRALGGGAAGAALARWVLGITFMLVVTARRGVPSSASRRWRRVDGVARWRRCLP